MFNYVKLNQLKHTNSFSSKSLLNCTQGFVTSSTGNHTFSFIFEYFMKNENKCNLKKINILFSGKTEKKLCKLQIRPHKVYHYTISNTLIN